MALSLNTVLEIEDALKEIADSLRERIVIEIVNGVITIHERYVEVR
jgi:predicted dinucleotide-binding enzyme